MNTVETITVPTAEEPFSLNVEATIVPGTGLAFHRRVVAIVKDEARFRFWHVTHLATKRRLPLEFESAREAESFILQITQLFDYVPAMPVLRSTLDEKQSRQLLGFAAYGVHAKVQIEAEQEASC